MEQFGLRTRIIMGDGLDSLTAGMKKRLLSQTALWRRVERCLM